MRHEIERLIIDLEELQRDVAELAVLSRPLVDALTSLLEQGPDTRSRLRQIWDAITAHHRDWPAGASGRTDLGEFLETIVPADCDSWVRQAVLVLEIRFRLGRRSRALQRRLALLPANDPERWFLNRPLAAVSNVQRDTTNRFEAIERLLTAS